MHLLSVCFISYIKRYGKSFLVSVSDLFMQTRQKPKAKRLVPVWERLLYLHAAPTASTDTDNRFKEACVCVCVCVSEEATQHHKNHISRDAESQVFFLAMRPDVS